MQRPEPNFSYLVGTVAVNLFFSGMFLNAIIFPERNADFILRIGIMIFVLELLGWFISIFIGTMGFQIAGVDTQLNTRGDSEKKHERFFRILAKIGLMIGGIPFLLAFGIALLLIGHLFKNIIAPALVFISMVTRYFSKGVVTFARKQLILFLFAFIPSCILAALISPYVQIVFPVPSEIIERILSTTDGFERTPLWFMVWGILYYFFVAVAEVVLFLRNLRPQEQNIHA